MRRATNPGPTKKGSLKCAALPLGFKLLETSLWVTWTLLFITVSMLQQSHYSPGTGGYVRNVSGVMERQRSVVSTPSLSVRCCRADLEQPGRVATLQVGMSLTSEDDNTENSGSNQEIASEMTFCLSLSTLLRDTWGNNWLHRCNISQIFPLPTSG